MSALNMFALNGQNYVDNKTFIHMRLLNVSLQDHGAPAHTFPCMMVQCICTTPDILLEFIKPTCNLCCTGNNSAANSHPTHSYA